MAELVVLGNGFDLAIKLKTKFEDFIDSIKPKMENLYGKMNFTDIEFLETKYDENYWALLLFITKLYGKDVSEWNNVEKLIKEVIISTCNNWQERNMLKDLLKIEDEDQGSALLNSYSTVLINFRRMRMSMDGLEFIESKVSIVSFLFNELLLFEKSFADYINRIDEKLNNENEFHKLITASMLLGKITGKLPNRSNQSTTFGHKVHILSFNYTNYLAVDNLFSGVRWDSYDTYSPIHGMAKYNNIIIGFDETNLKADEPEYCFTKTSRLLNSPLAESESYNTFMRNDISSIKFYGHSLSEYDYSYFQSIFDYYNIYDSVVKLEFLFTDYDPSVNIRGIYTNSVIKLMKDYGESLDNVKHGRNLLHKMIIEGRLKIKEITMENPFI